MAGWNPWRTLRERRHLRLEWLELPEGVGGMWSGQRIVLDPRLGRVERRDVLGHELVHEERGVGRPWATEATMQREEAIVRRITACRLVPLDDLERLLRARAEVDDATVWIVQAEFDVGEAVALEAVRHLQARLLERELYRAQYREAC